MALITIDGVTKEYKDVHVTATSMTVAPPPPTPPPSTLPGWLQSPQGQYFHALWDADKWVYPFDTTDVAQRPGRTAYYWTVGAGIAWFQPNQANVRAYFLHDDMREWAAWLSWGSQGYI